MRYKVMKPIPTSLSSLIPKGEIVDCSEWPVRNLQSLLRQGYLQEVIRDVQRESQEAAAQDLASGLAVAWQAASMDTTTAKQTSPPSPAPSQGVSGGPPPVSQPRGSARPGGKS